MGRQSKRVRERRKQQQEQTAGEARPQNQTRQTSKRSSGRRPAPAPTSGIRWSLIAPVVVVVVAILAFAYFAFMRNGSAGGTPPPTPVPIAVASEKTSSTAAVDGIPCTNEMLTYHVHAHLDIEYLGRPVTVPAYVGIRNNTCLYWLHTHDASGVIHIEAPHKVQKTLGNFFDIWGQPLSRGAVATQNVPQGKTMKVWVNGKIYTGDPRSIVLTAHEKITIDIGPPFPGPQSFTFPAGD